MSDSRSDYSEKMLEFMNTRDKLLRTLRSIRLPRGFSWETDLDRLKQENLAKSLDKKATDIFYQLTKDEQREINILCK